MTRRRARASDHRSSIDQRDATTIQITAQTTSLASQIKDLTLREIVEGDGEAIYYVGDTPVAKDESLVFDVQVTPEGETQSHRLRFTRHFTY